jgi:AcrR family transcriptional regulator
MTGRPAGGPGHRPDPGEPALAGASGPDRAPPADRPARERILDAAERLFAERGFDRTSTARIAAAARVPHGLIFYHFKTKMDLLLAVVHDSEVIVPGDLLPQPRAGADLHQAVAELWQSLSTTLGQPSTVRRIVFQELAAHPEVRQRALELQDRVSALVSEYLAGASRHAGRPLPKHEAAARLLTIAAGMTPLLGEAGQGRLDPVAVTALITDGLRAPEPRPVHRA